MNLVEWVTKQTMIVSLSEFIFQRCQMVTTFFVVLLEKAQISLARSSPVRPSTAGKSLSLDRRGNCTSIDPMRVFITGLIAVTARSN